MAPPRPVKKKVESLVLDEEDDEELEYKPKQISSVSASEAIVVEDSPEPGSRPQLKNRRRILEEDEEDLDAFDFKADEEDKKRSSKPKSTAKSKPEKEKKTTTKRKSATIAHSSSEENDGSEDEKSSSKRKKQQPKKEEPNKKKKTTSASSSSSSQQSVLSFKSVPGTTFQPAAWASKSPSKPAAQATKPNSSSLSFHNESPIAMSKVPVPSSSSAAAAAAAAASSSAPSEAISIDSDSSIEDDSDFEDLTIDNPPAKSSASSSSSSSASSSAKAKPQKATSKKKKQASSATSPNSIDQEDLSLSLAERSKPTAWSDLNIQKKKLTEIETWLKSALLPSPPKSQYVSSKHVCRVLFLVGPPGCGKSTLVRLLISQYMKDHPQDHLDLIQYTEPTDTNVGFSGHGSYYGNSNVQFSASRLDFFRTFLNGAFRANLFSHSSASSSSSSSASSASSPFMPPSDLYSGSVLLVEDLPNVRDDRQRRQLQDMILETIDKASVVIANDMTPPHPIIFALTEHPGTEWFLTTFIKEREHDTRCKVVKIPAMTELKITKLLTALSRKYGLHVSSNTIQAIAKECGLDARSALMQLEWVTREPKPVPKHRFHDMAQAMVDQFTHKNVVTDLPDLASLVTNFRDDSVQIHEAAGKILWAKKKDHADANGIWRSKYNPEDVCQYVQASSQSFPAAVRLLLYIHSNAYIFHSPLHAPVDISRPLLYTLPSPTPIPPLPLPTVPVSGSSSSAAAIKVEMVVEDDDDGFGIMFSDADMQALAALESYDTVMEHLSLADRFVRAAPMSGVEHDLFPLYGLSLAARSHQMLARPPCGAFVPLKGGGAMQADRSSKDLLQRTRIAFSPTSASVMKVGPQLFSGSSSVLMQDTIPYAAVLQRSPAAVAVRAAFAKDQNAFLRSYSEAMKRPSDIFKLQDADLLSAVDDDSPPNLPLSAESIHRSDEDEDERSTVVASSSSAPVVSMEKIEEFSDSDDF